MIEYTVCDNVEVSKDDQSNFDHVCLGTLLATSEVVPSSVLSRLYHIRSSSNLCGV